MNAPKRDLVIVLLAQVLAGLQVPMSIDASSRVLGTVREPWARLRDYDLLDLFGYPTQAEHEAALRKVLLGQD